MLRFGASISRARRTFCEANVPVVASLMDQFVVPIEEVQMKPRLILAALITWRVNRELVEERKMHHVYSLSKSAENRGA